jgi:endonuclease/exonuclease/phosphatase family metal-dependent hydrolase
MYCTYCKLLLAFLFVCTTSNLKPQIVFIELNCENLFDCRDDSLKQDEEFLPDGLRRWKRTRYWRKLNNIGQELLSCSDCLPDLVALLEVENDTVLFDLTRRSLLRNAGYHYLMTDSPDERGLDVALLWQPASFRPICYDTYTVPVIKNMRPTRDILYVMGETIAGDTLHIFVVHAPSRYGGEKETRQHRLQVVQVLQPLLEPLLGSKVIIAGDFNDYADSPSMRMLCSQGLVNATARATGSNGAKGTYRYQGEWRSIDHVLLSPSMDAKVDTAYINDALFLLEDEPRYGGKRPRRTFQGFNYRPAFSDHLPLVVKFK